MGFPLAGNSDFIRAELQPVGADQFIANALLLALHGKAQGISVNEYLEKAYAEYLENLSSGSFQLYLGEVKFTDNMDVSSLFLQGGSAAFGLLKATQTEGVEEGEEQKPQTTSSQTVLDEFYKGNATVKDVASVLQTEMDVVPLCFRTGVLFYNSNIQNVKNSSLDDIYFSIESYLSN